MTKQPYSNFDLPRQHLDIEGHYAPPKARDQDEIDRRRQLRPGSLLKEQQVKGIAVARRILERVAVGENTSFTTQTLGMAAINTSWYIFGKDAPDVMRRRLILPKIADHETDERITPTALRHATLDGLQHAQYQAFVVADSHKEGLLTSRLSRSFGRHVGNVSLQLALMGDGQHMITGSAFEVQEEARRRALDLLDDSRQFGGRLEAHPSLVQLADPDSPLGVYWRREAPNGAYEAYEAALITE